MSNSLHLAEHATGLAITMCGLASNADPTVATAVLGTVAYKAFTGSEKRGALEAAKAALNALNQADTIDDTHIEAALKAIRYAKTLAIDPSEIAAKIDTQDATQTVLNATFGRSWDENEDEGVVDALRIAVGAALIRVRKSPSFDAPFTQDLLIKLVREQDQLRDLIEEVLRRLPDDKDPELVRNLIEKNDEYAHELGLKDGLLIGLAREYGSKAKTFDDALRDMRNAMASVSQDRSLSAAGSNYGKDFDDLVAQFDALTDQDRFKEAGDLIQSELATRRDARERQKEEDKRVLDKAILHAQLTNDADAYAAYQLEKIQLGTPNAEDQWQALNALRSERNQTGIRTGAPFLLSSAIGLARKCISVAPSDYIRAGSHINLGLALNDQGLDTDGPQGSKLLSEAVEAYDIALNFFSQTEHPYEWATTQNNKGIALRNQGTRTEGARGAALLAQAVAAFDTALEVRTRQDNPVDWASTQNNKGNTLSDQGIRTEGAAGAALLAQAVAAFDAALEVRTRQDHSVDWAMMQNNKGTALQDQGIRTKGAAGAALLAQAVAAFDTALEVRTRQDHPMDWAATQNNKGIALTEQGIRTEGAQGAELLAEAVAAYDAALEVYTRQDHSVQWAMTQENLAIAKEAWADHRSASDPRTLLTEALAHVDAALTVFDPEHMSYNHAKATRRRDSIRAKLDALP